MRREAGHVQAVLRAESDDRRAAGKHCRVIHVSVNPPPSEWGSVDTPRGFQRLRTRVYRVARKAGVEGGCAIFHRVRCADKDDPVETDGPHFHVLGFGWLRGDTFQRTGWVVKNHGVRWTPEAVRGTATYVLSHSHRAEGISQEGKSGGVTLTVTWFGRGVRAADVPTEGPFCPLCERCYPSREWMNLEWAGQGPPPTEAVVRAPGEWRAWELDRTAWPPQRVEVWL